MTKHRLDYAQVTAVILIIALLLWGGVVLANWIPEW